MADGLLTMFGKTYNTVGSANTNLILLTKGDLKIRWGNKFIDLIKNGKINAEQNIVKTADSSENISIDGIYLIKNENKDEIWIKAGKTLINLNQEITLEYISYKEEQKLTSDEKFIALSNIGLIFDTYANLVTSGIKNGFAYVMETNRFFSIVNGTFSEYVFNTKIPDPLEIGNITIKGSTEEIISKTKLNIDSNDIISLKIGGFEKILIANDKVNYNLYIASDKGIQSNTYNSNVGYFVGINSENKAIGVFDEIIVRNGITHIQQVTYNELRRLMKSKSLIVNCEYEIIDFLDIRNITYESETVLKNSNDNEIKFKNVYPIIVKAKNSSELESEGYFSENPSWVIEYDPYYLHIVKYRNIVENGVETNNYEIAYSKGRIVKMIDEFGNTSNFDFKHSTFTEYKKYLFNTNNPRINELNKLIELNSTGTLLLEKAATNIYADATLDIGVTITVVIRPNGESIPMFERIRNTQIINNIIYLEEPTLEDSLIVENTKVVKFNDYIIFDNCETLLPNNNIINNVKGKFIISKQFTGNVINSIVYESDEEYLSFPIFTDNTAEILYLKNVDEEELKFDINSTYSNNTFGEVSNTTFKKGLTNNSFKNLLNVVIDNIITNNTFESNLQDLHIISANMTNNIFKGTINTYLDSETYSIKGTLINNTFEGNLEGVIFASTCNLSDNKFVKDVKYGSGIFTTFRGSISRCQFGEISGCIFEGNSLLYNNLFYNEDLRSYIDISLVTIDKQIRNSLFGDNVTNVHFYDNINRTTFLGIIGNSSNLSTIGKISDSTFIADVLYIIAKDSTINYSEFILITELTVRTNAVINNCTFNGEINKCTISGDITSCEFLKLTNEIQVTGSFDNTIIQVDMTPTAARYVENPNNSSTYIENNPFIISTEKIPKLSISGKKTCSILIKSYNGSNVKIFTVKTAYDDYTPTGIITMFSGTVSQIPDGWAICDGTKGTPDLRGRFIRMISNGEAVGAKNNSDLVTNGNGTRQAYLDGDHVPSHTHVYKTYSDTLIANTSSLSVSYNGDASHNLSVDTSGLSVTVNSSSTKYIYTYYNDGDTSTGNYLSDTGTSEVYSYKDAYRHSHTASIGGSAYIDGSITLPSISISGSISVPINFTPALDVDNFPKKVNIEPLAYALIFIMKL